jgi:hypothetical protein
VETTKVRASYRHGLYARPVKPIANLDDLIDDLFLRQTQMAFFLDKTFETGPQDIDYFVTLTTTHITNGLRISRVLRQKQTFDLQQDQNQITEHINAALDLLSLEVELDL